MNITETLFRAGLVLGLTAVSYASILSKAGAEGPDIPKSVPITRSLDDNPTIAENAAYFGQYSKYIFSSNIWVWYRQDQLPHLLSPLWVQKGAYLFPGLHLAHNKEGVSDYQLERVILQGRVRTVGSVLVRACFDDGTREGVCKTGTDISSLPLNLDVDMTQEGVSYNLSPFYNIEVLTEGGYGEVLLDQSLIDADNQQFLYGGNIKVKVPFLITSRSYFPTVSK